MNKKIKALSMAVLMMLLTVLTAVNDIEFVAAAD